MVVLAVMHMFVFTLVESSKLKLSQFQAIFMVFPFVSSLKYSVLVGFKLSTKGKFQNKFQW